jgi:hypothetical protein
MSRKAELLAFALSDSMLERQVIRLLCFAIGLLSVLFSVQLFITSEITNYETWIQKTIGSNLLAESVITLPLILGSILIAGKIFRVQKVILASLFAICLYNMLMALLNGVAYAFQATPMLLHTTIGVFAAILYGYYFQRDDHVQDKDVL